MSKQRFSKVPHWLLAMVAAGEVSGAAIITYVALGKYVKWGSGEAVAWPSQATLAGDTGLSERTVRGHLKELEDAGVIGRTARSSRSGRKSDLITLATGRIQPPATGEELPPATGRKLPGNKNQLNETPNGTVVGSSTTPKAVSNGAVVEAADTMSEPPPLWVQELPWLSPEKWQMLTSAIHHVNLVTEVGTYLAWTNEHTVAQTFSGFWTWVSKHEATAKTDVSAEEKEQEGMRVIMRLAQAAEEQS